MRPLATSILILGLALSAGSLPSLGAPAATETRAPTGNAQAAKAQNAKAETPSFMAGQALADAMATFRALPRPAACGRPKVLILYDTAGEWGYYGELYAIFTANLAGRWDDYDAEPVSHYRSGQIGRHAAVVVIGSSFGEPLPDALVEDLARTTRPIVWMQNGLDDLAERSPGFAARYGFTAGLLDHGGFERVDYRGVAFTRYTEPASLETGTLATLKIVEPAKVEVLAQAVRRGDGVRLPWAVRSGNLTYITENPLAFTSESDRYLIFADILSRVLSPQAPQTHSALVRIEDVGPDANPAALRAIADDLASRHAPFSVAVYDTYLDPLATVPGGPRRRTLAEAPEVTAALRYMQGRGGTLIMHGHTHQFGQEKNPYSGKSAADFEFFRAHVDAADQVQWDGPDAGDSFAGALGRIDEGLAEWRRAGLERPTIFEFPHYAASALDYAASARRFPIRYEHAMYYTGALIPVSAEGAMFSQQFFPYPARDIHGQVVLPEDLGNYSPYAFNQHLPRSAEQILAMADREAVMRDGVASFYFHWYLDPGQLNRIVDGLQAKGWTFVTPAAVAADVTCR